MSIALKTTEYSAWVHSLNFVDDTTNINTWVDWHLVPMSRPLVNAPKMKTCIVDIPGADGQIDLSTVVSGKPVYSNRTGSWEFMVQNGWNPNRIDNVNPDDLGMVTGPLFGSRTVKEVHIQCPDTGYTIVVGVRYNNSPPKMQRFGYTIDPDGNKITPWSGGIATNYDYNARVVSVKWVTDELGVRRLHVEYYAEKSDGSGKTFTDIQTYNKKIYGTGNQNVSIVESFAYDTATWSTMFSLIMNTLNGKTMKVLLDNESVLNPETNTYSPSWYYEGLITIDNWKTGDKYSTISIAYDLKPYKYSYDDPTIKSL